MAGIGSLDGAIWIASILCEAMIVVALIRGGLASKWRSLLVFEAFQVANSLSLAGVLARSGVDSSAYCYAYSIGSVFSYILELWIVVSLAKVVFAWVATREKLANWIEIALALSMTAGVALELVAPANSEYHHFAVRGMASLERIVLCGWCGAFLVLLVAAGASGLRWRRFEARLLVSFAGSSAMSLLWDAVSAYGPLPTSTATAVNALYLALAIYLLYAVTLQERSPAVAFPEELRAVVKTVD